MVGEEHTRSKTMDKALADAIDNNGLEVLQVLLPSNAPPWLNTTKLPLVWLTDNDFVHGILFPHILKSGLQVLHATDRTVAKILMTATYNANIASPALREAHGHVGWYLATKFLTDLIGIEPYTITHIQGHKVDGHQLLYKQQTLIMALMRGREPMALSVNEAFSHAMFLHANYAEDITSHYLQDQHTVVLVDLVVNSRKTVMEFVQHICKLHATICIMVITGVVQN
ncbi:hypothetical protein FQN50_006458 [Emmonsiellopsis sp. PD_5]|nr:hypothetical protein FQN50_006458 [Emmonsiellopsis sp. PD_5]